MKNTSDRQKKIKKLSKSGNWRILIVFIAVFALIGSLFLYQTNAGPKNRSAVTLSLAPSSQKLALGDTLSVAIRLDTNGTGVNAVQSNVSYPADKFEFVSIDATGSSFEVEAQNTGSQGLVQIARGTISSVNSNNAHIATINLRTIGTGRKVSLKFADGTAVVSSTTSENILQKLVGGQYSIQ